jgi:hypothetical protein
MKVFAFCTDPSQSRDDRRVQLRAELNSIPPEHMQSALSTRDSILKRASVSRATARFLELLNRFLAREGSRQSAKQLHNIQELRFESEAHPRM